MGYVASAVTSPPRPQPRGRGSYGPKGVPAAGVRFPRTPRLSQESSSVNQFLEYAFAKELCGLLGQYRATEIIALTLAAAVALQKLKLLAGFYPFGDHALL